MIVPLRKIAVRFVPGMSVFSLRLPASVAVALLIPLLLVAAPSNGEDSTPDLRLPISLDADSTDYDGKSSMLRFKGLRLSQGNISVQADEGLATKLDFDDSLWHFNGNVIIDTENGHIECDAADLNFANHQLQLATITGSPASFRIQRADSEDSTYAEADRLKYDFELGVVKFLGNARITEGGNQISSSYLVYNIAEQKINAQSAGSDGERVKIIYTPRQEPDASSEDDTSDAPPDNAGGTPDTATESAGSDASDIAEQASDGVSTP